MMTIKLIRLLSLCLLLCTYYTGFSQLNSTFIKSYGDQLDNGFGDVKYIPSENAFFAIGGKSNNGASRKGTFSKLDVSGNLIWTKYFHTLNGSLRNFSQMDNGNFMLCGYRGNNYANLYLAIVDSQGNLISDKVLDNPGRLLDPFITKMKNDPLGETYVIANWDATGGDDWAALKMDANLNILWSNNYWVGGDDEIFDAIALDNGHTLLIGSSSSTTWQGLLVEIDENGQAIEGTKCTDPTTDNYIFTGGIKTQDGGFAFVGRSRHNKSRITKLDANFNHVWSARATFPSATNNSSLVEDKDGNLYVAEFMNINNIFRPNVMKFTASGSFLWCKRLENAIPGQKYGIFIGYTGITSNKIVLTYTDKITNGFGEDDAVIALLDTDLNSCSTSDFTPTISSFTGIISSFTMNQAAVSYIESNIGVVSNISYLQNDVCNTTSPPTGCAYTDSLALVTLYNSTNGNSWSNSWNLNQSMDTWNGITLNSNRCVTEIILGNNQLNGTIPPELANLNHLTTLYLYGNQLYGSIPYELGNITTLVSLLLNDNQLSGTIPYQLGFLSNLAILQLNQNQLSGNIPPELSYLSNLAILWLHENQLSGNIPPELGDLTVLQDLYLNNNQLSGSIPPELGNLSNLDDISLNNNQLSGCFDSQLNSLCNTGYNFSNNPGLPGAGNFGAFCANGAGDCTPTGCAHTDSLALVALYNATDGSNWSNTWDLNQSMDTWYGISLNNGRCVTQIIMSNNQLFGTLPADLGNLENLTRLNLYNNDLSGNLPPEIGNLTNLVQLDLGLNQLSGSIPSTWGNLANLNTLYLDSNQLTGSIPTEIGNLTNLNTLYLNNNQLSGSIPVSLGNLGNLTRLYLNNNQLSGNIPSEFGMLFNLSDLYLQNNQLSGSIPMELGDLSGLNRLYLNNNQLTGSIPARLGNLTNLTHLYANSNQLSGCFSAQLASLCNATVDFSSNTALPGGGDFAAFCADGTGNCTPVGCAYLDSLALIVLYNATDGPNWTNTWNLNQPIDTWHGITVNTDRCVTEIDLTNNQLDGTIPAELENLTNLTILILQNNQLDGTIPASLGNLSNLTRLDLSRNDLTGSIPVELGMLSNLTSLFLGSNLLSGAIPAVLGNLINLTTLYLYNNQLNSAIPTELGNLSSLVFLHLYNNQLSGTIPSSLGNLSNLQWFILGINQLSGTIPASLGNLSSLTYLYLNNNQLTGAIPSSLGNLTSLIQFRLHDNQLTDAIPGTLGNLTNLNALYIYNNQLSGCFDDALSALCSQDVNVSNNPDLPGNGDFAAFCNNNTGSCTSADVCFAIGDVCGNPNGTVSVPVIVNNFTAIGGFQFSIHIPAGVGILLDPPTDNFGLPNMNTGGFTRYDDHTITLSWAAPDVFVGETVPDGTTIFSIEIQLIGTPGATGQIYIDGNPTAVEVIQNLTVVNPQFKAGNLCTESSYVIDGQIYTYYNVPINNVYVDLTGDMSLNTNTDAFGLYEFEDINPTSNLTVTPSKNTDAGNGVSIFDIIRIRGHIQQVSSLIFDSPYQYIAADVNGSGSVSILDIIYIQRVIQNAVPNFPINKSWRFIPSDYIFPDSTNPYSFPEDRSYMPINQNEVNQDFIGIKLGDVNQTATVNPFSPSGDHK